VLFSCSDDGTINLFDLGMVRAMGEKGPTKPTPARGSRSSVMNPSAVVPFGLQIEDPLKLLTLDSSEFTVNGKPK
jgi:hypothetical protein